MNKAKFLKVILPSMLGLVGAPVLIASTVSAAVLTTTNNAKATRSNDQSTYYLYDNQYFNNLEEATKYAIIKNQPISSDFYIGNAQNAVFDQETGRLDISKLRLGDKSRLYPAYKNALGQYTPSYQEAKKSFVNPGLIQYKYDDLNGRLFNSYEEAKESMENNRYATPVTYYDGLNINGNEVKLNPFNKDDINEFKWLALDTLVNQKTDNNSHLSWSVFTKLDNGNGTYTYTDQLNRLFDYKYSFLESVDYVVNKILQFKYDILNHMDFEAELTLQQPQYEKYDFKDFSFDKNRLDSKYRDINAYLVNDSEIKFTNLDYSQLEEFNSFFDRDKLWKLSGTGFWIDKTWAGWWVAENKNINNFLGAKFNIKYWGSNWGWASGTDVQILQPGADKGKELKFNVKVSKQNTPKNRLLENYFQNSFTYNDFKAYLDLDKKKCQWSAFDNSLPSEIKDKKHNNNEDNPLYNPFADGYIKTIFDAVNKPGNDDLSIKRIYNNVDYHKGDTITTILKDENNIDWQPRGFCPLFDYNDKSLQRNLDNNVINDNSYTNTNPSCNPKLEILQNIPIQDYFQQNQSMMNPIINFNGYPLFMVNNSLGIEANGYEKIGSTLDHKQYQNPVTNVVDVNGKNNLLNIDKVKEYLNDKNEHFNEITDNLINVSQSYSINKTDKGEGSIKSFKTKLINNQEQLLGNYLYYDNNHNLKFKDEFENQNLKPASLLGEETKWSLASVIASYNKCMSNIMKKYEQIPSYTLSKLVNPNDILFLRNSENNSENNDIDDNILQFNYGEILSRPDDINVSVMNNNNLKVFYDQDKLKNAIKNSALTDPAKVVVLYDLMGNIINPGVKLSSSEELLTTSDAIYDSESTIMDNILRTKVIKNDPSKTFYLEDDGRTYTLLDNQANLIYNLAIEGKTYYFITYQNAWWYYYDYVKLNSVKVVK